MYFYFIKKIKYCVLIILSVCILSGNVVYASADNNYEILKESSLYARYAALIDGNNNRLLYGKNADTAVPMASTTKIMTCVIALEYAPLELECVTSKYAVSMPEVKLNVSKDEIFCLEDLLYSLMLKSHNDTAVIIAENVARYYLSSKKDLNEYSSEELVKVFCGLMNEKAASLGCNATYYITPNGLDASDEYGTHSTTAYELAVIMSYCIQNEVFLKITQTQEYRFSSDKRSYSLSNANSFLNMYPDIISGKTGFTSKAGYCYVCAYKDEDKTLISVVLASGWPYNKTYKWSDTKKLLDYGRNNYVTYTLLRKDEILKDFMYRYGYEYKSVTPKINIHNDCQCLLKATDKVNVVYSYICNGGEYIADNNMTKIGTAGIYINDSLYKTFDIITDSEIKKTDYIYYFLFCIDKFFVK